MYFIDKTVHSRLWDRNNTNQMIRLEKVAARDEASPWLLRCADVVIQCDGEKIQIVTAGAEPKSIKGAQWHISYDNTIGLFRLVSVSVLGRCIS